ncbi:hypothetical protein GQ457_10G005240 [Hibiscus cannabinus]
MTQKAIVTPLSFVGKACIRGSSNQFNVLVDVVDSIVGDVVKSSTKVVLPCEDASIKNVFVHLHVAVVVPDNVPNIDALDVIAVASVMDEVVNDKVLHEHSPRKTRNASHGVAHLLQEIRQRRNLKGLNSPIREENVVKRMSCLNVDVVCLLETRVKVDNTRSIVDRWFKGWTWFSNYSFPTIGRMWMQLWIDLGVVRDLVGSSPWLLAGDFNVTLNIQESSVDSYSTTSDMSKFQQCLVYNELMDFPCSDPLFTWSNHQGDRPLARKLDRLLTNLSWYFAFPHAHVEFCAPEFFLACSRDYFDFKAYTFSS